MKEETKALAKMILAEIANSKRYSEAVEPHELFLSAETIISALASLISPLMEAEQAYNQKVSTYAIEHSVSKAEVIAKAGDEYLEWKKLKMVYDLAESQTQMLKKFSDRLQGEYKRS